MGLQVFFWFFSVVFHFSLVQTYKSLQSWFMPMGSAVTSPVSWVPKDTDATCAVTNLGQGLGLRAPRLPRGWGVCWRHKMKETHLDWGSSSNFSLLLVFFDVYITSSQAVAKSNYGWLSTWNILFLKDHWLLLIWSVSFMCSTENADTLMFLF